MPYACESTYEQLRVASASYFNEWSFFIIHHYLLSEMNQMNVGQDLIFPSRN